MRLLCRVLFHRAPTTYGPHFLRSNPAPPPRASPLTSSLHAELSIILSTSESTSPCMPRPARPPTPHPTRAAWCTSVLFHIPRHREPHGLSLHGTCLWFSLDSHPTMSSLSQSFAHTYTYTHTPLPVSLAHSPLFRSLVSHLHPPRSIYSRPPSISLSPCPRWL